MHTKRLKFKVAALALLMSVAVSHATINITWNWDESAATGIFLEDGVTLLPIGSLVQLIFTTGGVVPGIDMGDPTAIPVGDELISSAVTTGNGFYTFGPANYGGLGDYVGGFVYHRVFTADISPTTGEYGLGTQVYGASPANTATAEGSTVFSFLYDSGDPTYSSGFIMTAIPEPSVFAMLGLGGLLLVVRRRFIAS